jgi:hypothetical protein
MNVISIYMYAEQDSDSYLSKILHVVSGGWSHNITNSCVPSRRDAASAWVVMYARRVRVRGEGETSQLSLRGLVCHGHSSHTSPRRCSPIAWAWGVKTAWHVSNPPKVEGLPITIPAPPPSSGLMSFSSGILRTLTTSPSCPSPRTASGSPTFSSMNCEYCHQRLGGWGSSGAEEARHWEARSLMLHSHVSFRLQVVDQLSLTFVFFPYVLFYKTSPFLCLMLRLYLLV